MSRFVLSVLLAAAVSGSVLSAYAGPARFTAFSYDGHDELKVDLVGSQYRNPILGGYYPDPSVTRVGDDYYLVNSSFSNYPGLPVFTSKNLVDWHQVGNAIDRPDQVDLSRRRASEGLYAPDISYHDGLFYIVNTCVGCKGNFVITAKDPAGPWSDPVWLDFEGIDPSIYWEGDKAYIVNNRAPNEPERYGGHRAIWIQEFDWHQLKMVGPSTQLVNGGVDLAKKPIWIEGPHLFRKDGYYYLIAAEGGTASQHSEVVFRSQNLTGPFAPGADNPMLTQRDLPAGRPNPISSAGHADFVETQTGQWWSVFLATRPYQDDLYNTGRETFLLPVSWKDGWPTILPPETPVPTAVARPDLPLTSRRTEGLSGDVHYSEVFKASKLPLAWIGYRIPKAPIYHIDKGALVLSGAAPLGDISGTPAFIGRRQQNANAAISTVIKYRPSSDGDRAGLVALQSDEAYLIFGIARIGGRDAIALFKREKGGDEKIIASAPLAVGKAPVSLNMNIEAGRVSFTYVLKGVKQTLIENTDATFLSTGRAGGFTGTIIGLYAWSSK